MGRAQARIAWRGLLLGSISAGLALLAGVPLEPIAQRLYGEGSALFRAFVLAGILEESVKLLAARQALRWAAPEDSSIGLHALLSGIAAGAGFAVMESIAFIASGPRVLALRAVTALPLHLSCSAIAAQSLSAITKRPFWMIIAAIVLHGAYDYALFSLDIPNVLALVPLLLAGSWAVGLARRGPVES